MINRLIVALWLSAAADKLPPCPDLTDPTTPTLAWLCLEIARRHLVMSLFGAAKWSDFDAMATSPAFLAAIGEIPMLMLPRLTVQITDYSAFWHTASAYDRQALDAISRCGRSAGVYLFATL